MPLSEFILHQSGEYAEYNLNESHYRDNLSFTETAQFKVMMKGCHFEKPKFFVKKLFGKLKTQNLKDDA